MEGVNTDSFQSTVLTSTALWFIYVMCVAVRRVVVVDKLRDTTCEYLVDNPRRDITCV